MRNQIGQLLVAASLTVGCSGEDTVKLTSDNGNLALRYACTAPIPRALDEGTVDLVRDVVIRETSEHIVAVVATREVLPRRNAELEARNKGDTKALERAVSGYVCAHGPPPTRPPRFPELGSAPPNFVLTPMQTKSRSAPVRLSDLRGRAVLLVFWLTWCTACREEYRELQRIAARAEAEPITVYAFLHGDTKADLRKWQREHGAGVPFLDDPDGEIARLYGVHWVPYTVVVRPDGKVQAAGHVSPAQLSSVVSEALSTGSSPDLIRQLTLVSGGADWPAAPRTRSLSRASH